MKDLMKGLHGEYHISIDEKTAMRQCGNGYQQKVAICVVKLIFVHKHRTREYFSARTTESLGAEHMDQKEKPKQYIRKMKSETKAAYINIHNLFSKWEWSDL